ncbi:hypothetical protein BDF19DRAFT_464784 [Syncephalis fuscata]|nr:hypothetical protein BDF19DRAFT_464784 [Syncephalis fuscata]
MAEAAPAAPAAQHPFTNDQRGIPFHRRRCIFLLLFFLIPRRPYLLVNDVEPLYPVRSSPLSVNGLYMAHVVIKNPNFINWELNEIKAEVYDAVSDKHMGGGIIYNTWLHKRKDNFYKMPLWLAYNGTVAHDDVARRFANVCGTRRAPLPVKIKLRMDVVALPYHPEDWSTSFLSCGM